MFSDLSIEETNAALNKVVVSCIVIVYTLIGILCFLHAAIGDITTYSTPILLCLRPARWSHPWRNGRGLGWKGRDRYNYYPVQ